MHLKTLKLPLNYIMIQQAYKFKQKPYFQIVNQVDILVANSTSDLIRTKYIRSKHHFRRFNRL